MTGYFIYGDVDTRNYEGIVVSEDEVDSAPERAYEEITIAGRNGTLLLDGNRYENVIHSYDITVYDDYVDNLIKLRNDILSKVGYQVLRDSFNPDEKYLARVYTQVIPKQKTQRDAGNMHIEFSRKPQRFLVDGDREILPTEWTDLHTVTGDMVTVESDGSLAVKSLEVSLSPIQAGSGDPSPTNVRPISGRTEVVTSVAGKNLYEALTSGGRTSSGITWTYNADGSVTASGTATGNSWSYGTAPHATLKQGTYTASVKSPFGLVIQNITDGGYFYNGVNSTATFTVSKETIVGIHARVKNGTTINQTTGIMLEVGSSASEWQPYNGTTYTTALGRTVYGGTLDVVSGVLTVDRAMVTLNGSETWTPSNGTATACMRVQTSTNVGFKPNTSNASLVGDISSAFVEVTPNQTWDGTIGFSVSTDANPYLHFCQTGQKNMSVEAWKTYLASNPIQVVGLLATPQTYQLTPQQIELLVGENHLWSDGEITVEYGVRPYYNPTPFESKPLIKVTGTGTLGIGEYILTITGTASQTLYIDCETMEIYTLEGTAPTGASSLVSINRNDFPVLEPGTNYISVGSEITAVTITPRWWRI